MTSAEAVSAAVADALRRDHARVMAAIISRLGDWQVAEDALQDALERALQGWLTDGVPANPSAWLVTTARRRGIDLLRRAVVREATVRRLGHEAERGFLDSEPIGPDDDIGDDRLRLILTCAHPALDLDARVALTLRTVLGWHPGDIARAFLVQEAAMTKRLVRARAKIAHAGIPYRIPTAAELPDRLAGVLAVIYLLFTRGYAASQDDDGRRRALPAEAVRLTRLLRRLLPAEASEQLEVAGLLALQLAHHARLPARFDDRGAAIRLPDQDRARWDRAEIEEATDLLDHTLARAAHERIPVGPYVLQAAIAVEHVRLVGPPDWVRIEQLHRLLAEIAPTPAGGLAHAVAVRHARGPRAGLTALDGVGPAGRTHLWHAARADALHAAGDPRSAQSALADAIALAPTAHEVDELEELARSWRAADPRPPDGRTPR